MKDSIVIDMKYADYDMIDGSYGVERHHLTETVWIRREKNVQTG